MADFEDLYLEHFSGVYRYMLSLCRDEALAEEITQEAFYKAMEHIDRFRGDCQVFVWLCQIARNTYFSALKKQKRFVPKPAETSTEPGGHDVEKDVLDRDAARRLHSLLHDLPEPYKEVFTLRVFGELSFAHIGELFGKTDSWARLVFYRAKAKLRKELEA